ncbi:PPPDE peptidase domain-containing protein 2 [Papilio xuthus]|uniref:PPPDE peptidase domain-containing protein 2 n=1 Tax=Papilio xuthus TaxID=66420 RepID=A0A194QE14_PAPXU|nr:PPPDE peptidase domain-containing protein 2 [Papilio xuthus]
MAAEGEGSPVELYVYDLTHGLAALLSPSILGRQVAGVWHTAVVVFGREYFYGSGGITQCAPVSRLQRSLAP